MRACSPTQWLRVGNNRYRYGCLVKPNDHIERKGVAAMAHGISSDSLIFLFANRNSFAPPDHPTKGNSRARFLILRNGRTKRLGAIPGGLKKEGNSGALRARVWFQNHWYGSSGFRNQ